MTLDPRGKRFRLIAPHSVIGHVLRGENGMVDSHCRNVLKRGKRLGQSGRAPILSPDQFFIAVSYMTGTFHEKRYPTARNIRPKILTEFGININP
jgi:hypothetical protein